MQQLLTVQEVAEILNVSDKLVYRMANQGKIVPTPVEGCVRFHPDDVVAYLASQRVEKVERVTKTTRPRLRHIKLS